MPENIGRMDRLITIEQPTFTQNATGDRAQSWSEFAKVWARYVQLPRGEAVTADQRVAVKDVRYRMRYTPGVTELMRIVDGGREYYINRIEEVGRRESMVIHAEWRDSNT
jgi:SPP1 family predicted phage head-tail adaptor